MPRIQPKRSHLRRQRTLTLLKPDTVRRRLAGEVIRRYERAGMRIIALKMVRLTARKAKRLYRVHRHRSFFQSLTTYIASGPIIAMILEGDRIIERNRKLIGATNPRQAAAGTIRRALGVDIERNVVHASDSEEAARFEIPIFFSASELADLSP